MLNIIIYILYYKNIASYSSTTSIFFHPILILIFFWSVPFQARASYLEYQKITREVENLRRIHVAFQYVRAEEIKDRSANALKEAQTNKKKILESMAENEKKVKELAQQIEETEKKNNTVSENTDTLTQRC